MRQSDTVNYEVSTKGYYSAEKLSGHILLTTAESCYLSYLNGKSEYDYDEYSDRFVHFALPYNYYLLKCDNDEDQVLEIKDLNDSLKTALNRQMDRTHIRKSSRVDSLKSILRGIQAHIQVRKLLVGDLTSFGYYHPILFKEEGLYGYYPLHERAKYKELDEFVGEFARMKTADGLMGWVDTKGNEYFDSN